MKKLNKGLRRDELPIDQPDGSWRDAKNIVAYKKFQALSNENGMDEITPVTDGFGHYNYPSKNVIGVITMNEERILFFGSAFPIDSEIGRITKDGFYIPIIKDAILNFNDNFPINGTYEVKNNNTIISWTDSFNKLRILNIDCIPFKLNPDFSVKTSDKNKAKKFLSIFSDFNTPIINTDGYLKNGQYVFNVKVNTNGALLSGVYYPIFTYILPDGTQTGWSKVFNGIPIISDSVFSDGKKINGGIGGQPTNKSIDILFKNLDTDYEKIKVGYLYIKNGVTLAYEEPEVIITKSELIISLTGSTKVQLDLNEILIPNIIYDKAKSITNLQNRLYIANLEEPAEIDYQNFANLINVKWFRGDFNNSKELITNVQVDINSTSSGQNPFYGGFQAGENVFFNKNFKSGETYAFYIVFKLKNGRYSKSFHIPGRVVSTKYGLGDRDILTSATIPYINRNGTARRYQLANTAPVPALPFIEGEMGYWENVDEEYPLDPNNALLMHPKFNNINGVTISDRKVRHHTFPDLTSFYSNTNQNDRFVFNNNFYSYGGVGSNVGINYSDTLQTNPLGIKVSNINIPNNLLPLIDSYEICYAKRNEINTRVIGNDCTSYDEPYGMTLAAVPIKFQQFDLMTSKSGLFPNYIKPVWKYKSRNNDVRNFAEGLYASEPYEYNYVTDELQGIDPIIEHIYLGQNVTVPFNNTGRADCLYFTGLYPIDNLTSIPQALHYDINDNGPIPNPDKDIGLFDFCIYRTNMYKDFQNQDLISTGIGFKVTVAGIQSPITVWGGDTYINRYSVVPTDVVSTPMSYIVESVSNIGLRYEDLVLGKFFAPRNIGTPSWFGYNKDFNAINTFNKIDIYYPEDINGCAPSIKKLPNRIAFSQVSGSESLLLNWRNFKANSYYDTIKTKGEIWSILGSNRTLYIHLKYTLFLAQIKDSLATNTGEIFLGVTNIFDRPPLEVLTVNEGYAGTQSQFACILCKLGYCFIDRQAGKVFIYKEGQGLQEISNKGLYKYFLKYSEQTFKDIDNPYINNGFTLGFDEINNRLLVTKKVSEADNLDYAFTLSYTPDLGDGGAWVSFHDYFPNFYSYNRTGVHLINNDNQKYYKHNSKTIKAKYLDNLIKNSYIDVIINDRPDLTKRFDNVNWISNTELNNTNFENETFTHLLVYNDNQCTDVIDLKKDAILWYNKDAHNTEQTWNFNKFKDLLKNKNLPFLDEKNLLILTNIDTNKSWFNKSVFVSKYIAFRLINNNINQKDLHLTMIGSNFLKSDR